MNKLYTAQEVADKLKIKKTTVYEMIKRGDLASSKIGKQLRVSEEQLDQYLKGTQASVVPNPGFQPESSLLKRDYLLHSSGIILSGQTSPALDLLLRKVSLHPQGLPVLQSHMNSYNGLYSLYFGKVHIASADLSPESILRLVPGVSLTAVKLYDYPLGLYVQAENPKNIQKICHLTKPDITFINREKGSMRRILLDEELKKEGISCEDIQGYSNEMVSDHSTAAAVSRCKADVAIGEEFTSRYYPGVGFIPIKKMSMYMVMHTSSVHKPGFSAIIDIIRSEEFKTAIHNQTGYDIEETGTLLNL